MYDDYSVRGSGLASVACRVAMRRGLLLVTRSLFAERPVPDCCIAVSQTGRAKCRALIALSTRRGGNGSPFVITERDRDERQ